MAKHAVALAPDLAEGAYCGRTISLLWPSRYEPASDRISARAASSSQTMPWRSRMLPLSIAGRVNGVPALDELKKSVELNPRDAYTAGGDRRDR